MGAWQGTSDGVDHALAYEADLFEDAAGERDAGKRGIGIEVANVAESFDCIFAKQTAAEFENLQRNCVTLLSTFDNERGELRKIRRRRAIADVDNLFHGLRGPILDDAIQNLRGLSEVARAARQAQRLVTDPVTRSLIAERRTPATDVEHFALAGASHHIRSCSSHGQNSSPSRKGRVERDLFVAANNNFATRVLREDLAHPAIGLR